MRRAVKYLSAAIIAAAMISTAVFAEEEVSDFSVRETEIPFEEEETAGVTQELSQSMEEAGNTGKSAAEAEETRAVDFAENTIPVFYIHIDESKGTIQEMNESPDHSVKCYGTLDIKVPEGFVSEYTDEPQESLEGIELDYIRGRGNSTWQMPKKPYKLKFGKKQDLFGMGASKEWALLANRYDNSLIRNRITYWLGSALGMEFVPQCIPVDVVMNDEYLGSYLLCELIGIEESRTDIDPLGEEDSEDPEITGGYLLANGPRDAEPGPDYFITDQGMVLLWVDPDFKGSGTDAQKTYIENYVRKTEEALFGENFKDKEGKGIEEYMDIPSAVDYWWIQELSTNSDAYGGDSTYLNKKRNDLLYWGPLWDFDYVAWGNLQKPEDMYYKGFYNESSVWMDRLLWNAGFTEALEKRWPDIRECLVRMIEDGGIIDQYYEQTRISESFDIARWDFYRIGDIVPEEYSYKEEIARLKQWINLRMQWIDENIEHLGHPILTLKVSADGAVFDEVKTLWGRFVWTLPEAPEKEGYEFAGWHTADGEPWTEGMVYEDMIFYADYIPAEETAGEKE